ncbi:MAG TPA: GNAT family N-acetyltransferase [Candidatus Binatia bacterium]|jgi:putative acetyltransferase|nr:GNAT family N-acetyltransferase [Candidatus Binatia bacterium]
MDDQSFVIEPASPADAPAVIRLIGRVYDEYGFIFEPAAELPDLLAFTRHYVAPQGAFFVIRQNGQVVGSVGVERLGESSAELHRLYLEADLRGHGLGRALVEAVITWCRAGGTTHLLLWSDTRFDRAHVLYERMGFQRTGDRALNDINHTREYRYERLL